MIKEELAIFLHNEYEKQAKIVGWKTQDSCQVEFDKLPEANKKVMLAVAQAILDAGFVRFEDVEVGVAKKSKGIYEVYKTITPEPPRGRNVGK